MNQDTSDTTVEMETIVDQVRQLQEKVIELSSKTQKQSQDSAEDDGDDRRIVLVSNLPGSLATCDALYFVFEQFGIVERVKILHNKRNTGLVQMKSPHMAKKAVDQQDRINRIGTDIFVSYSNNIRKLRMPADIGLRDDGLSRDYTVAVDKRHRGRAPMPQFMPDYMQQPQGAPDSMAQYNTSPADMEYDNYGNPINNAGQMGNPGPGGNNSTCLLVSSLPEQLAKPEPLCNLFGYYGDVHRVKILRNKPDCALVQMAKPHQAAMCRNYLDQTRVAGKLVVVSFSRMWTIKMPAEPDPGDEMTRDFTNVPGIHRYRKTGMGQKLSKKLCAPTPILHVANIPEGFSTDDLRTYVCNRGFSVRSVAECGKDMALLHFPTISEAIVALADIHNTTPDGYGTRNNCGLCLSFSNRRAID